MHYVQPKDRYQTSFFTALDDYVSEDNPVRVIDFIVESIVKENHEAFLYKGQSNEGRKSYSPNTMLKLYIYGYLNGINSSRKLEKETHRNLEVKWLLGDLQPDHKTIANYRKDNKQQLQVFTRKFRYFLKDHGYIEGKEVAIDGTKVKANAKRRMLSESGIKKQLEKLDEKVMAYLQQLDENDKKDDLTDEFESSELTEENLRLLEKISKLEKEKEELLRHQEQLRSSGKNYISPTDRSANLMKGTDGKYPGYNVQGAVDGKYNMIADAIVSDHQVDRKLLQPVMESMKENLDLEPEIALADKGYDNPKMIEELEENSSTVFYIPKEETKRDKEEISFTYDQENDQMICSQGKPLKRIAKNTKKEQQITDVYQGTECDDCPVRDKCTRSKKGRIYNRYHNQQWSDDYTQRINSIIGKEYINKRKKIVEHVFGTIKYWMGKLPLVLRGDDGAQVEIDIYSVAYNLKRLYNVEQFDIIMQQVNAYDWRISS
jgi:transposase